MSSRKSAGIAYLVFLLCACPAAHVRAVTTSWNTDSSGSFTTAANWNFGVPTSQDTAVFNRGPVAYEVSFPVGPFFEPPPNYLVNYLRVHTNDVTFRRGRASDPTDTSPSLTVLNPDVSIVIGEAAGEVAILNTSLLSLSGANTSIGRNEGAEGTLNVNSGTFSMSGEISVGRSGTGTLNIPTGGQVESRSAVLGHLATGDGEANISGANALWTNANGLIVGHVGVGTLNITAGGRVQSEYGNLGQNEEGEGHAIVSGFNSQWQSLSVDVGVLGTGSLTIKDHGSVTGIWGSIGLETGSSGSVLVTGAGSTWQPSHLSVGGSGAGTLTIDAGGAVPHVLTSRIGLRSDGSGTVTISGAGSSLTTDVLDVGYNGAGTLRIEAGGTVLTENFANIGLNANSSGTVAVTGPGSRLTGGLVVGSSGAGAITVTDGGSVSSAVNRIGWNPGSSGAVTVRDRGSNWTNDEFVLGDRAAGRLTIEDGGSVVSLGGNYFAELPGVTGTATVSGAGSSWINGTVHVGVRGAGSMTIAAGGSVTTGQANGYDSYIGIYPGSVGAVTVTGHGSNWTTRSGLFVGVHGRGTLAIGAGGNVSSNFSGIGFRREDGDRDVKGGTVTVTGPGSTWTNSGGLVVGHRAHGRLTIEAGGSVSSSSGIIGGEGQDELGVVKVTGPGSTWTNSGELIIGDQILGWLTILDGGSVVSGGPLTIKSRGNLGGDGMVRASVINYGQVWTGIGLLPSGHSNGVLSVDGSYLQSAGGVLRVHLGGITPGSGHDRLYVSGAIALSGSLSVALVNSFVPSAGDEFDILDWGSLSGAFSAISLPPLATGLSWNIAQLYTAGIISVVGPPMLEADLDDDGDVDHDDLLQWQGDFGQNGLSDADDDGDSDGNDFLAWQRQVDQSGAAVEASVPEPCMSALAAVSLLVVFRARRPWQWL